MWLSWQQDKMNQWQQDKMNQSPDNIKGPEFELEAHRDSVLKSVRLEIERSEPDSPKELFYVLQLRHFILFLVLVQPKKLS